MNPLKAYIYPAYGLAGLGKVAVEVTLQLYLFDYYTRILGLSPVLAGGAFAVAILWDALSDIVVAAGLFKLRARGVTYSAVLWSGALLLAVTTVLLFSPFNTSSSLYLFLHLLIAYVLVNTGMTLLDLPQTSLSAELSHLSNERNKLLASRMGFGIVGLAVGSALPGLLLRTQGDDLPKTVLAEARVDSAWVLAALVLLSGTLTAVFLFRTEKSRQGQRPPEVPTLKEVKGVFRDRPFRTLLFAGVVAAVGRTINAALALMYYRYVLKLSEEAVTQIILPVFTLSIIFSIPLWVLLSKRLGKQRPAYLAVASLGVMGIIAYPSLPEEQLAPILAISILGGVLCGAVFLVDSMITDIIDHDERRSGVRKEALYFAVWKSGLKVARAAAFVLIGFGLELAGLDLSRESISRGAEVGIILLFGIVVGLCFVAGGWWIFRANVPNPVEDG
ncbi:MAG: MFS transporter [Opitutales bacterium]